MDADGQIIQEVPATNLENRVFSRDHGKALLISPRKTDRHNCAKASVLFDPLAQDLSKKIFPKSILMLNSAGLCIGWEVVHQSSRNSRAACES
jgi:hypothetical protein